MNNKSPWYLVLVAGLFMMLVPVLFVMLGDLGHMEPVAALGIIFGCTMGGLLLSLWANEKLRRITVREWDEKFNDMVEKQEKHRS